MSAILRVFNAEFRRPITRAAELMTSFSLICGGLFPIIHLGRAWVVYWMVPIPNQRGLWDNFQSPLAWDLLAITTYLLGSTIYVFLPMIPDLAMTRDHTTGWRHVLYKLTSLGWRGLEYEWHYLHKAINIFAFAIIPIMFSVHTIVSWDFAMAQQMGWHSSIFGPYFVVGAILSGVSAVIAVLLVVRKTMNLQYFLRPEHFDALAKLVLIFSLSWTYFFFNDYLVEWYGGDWVGHQLLTLPGTRADRAVLVRDAHLQHPHPGCNPLEQAGAAVADGAFPDRDRHQHRHVPGTFPDHPGLPAAQPPAFQLGRLQPAGT